MREHRFVVVFRGDNLGDAVNDTDPQQVGAAPLAAKGQDPASQRTADAVNRFVAEAGRVLKARSADQHGDAARLRSLSEDCHTERGVRSASGCVAVYPMYKGLARLVGMDVLDAGSTLRDQIETLKRVWNEYDFFFLHYKYTDSTGEDGNFAGQGRDDRTIRHRDSAYPGAEARRADRDRRPQHAEQDEESQLASGAGVLVGKTAGPTGDGVWRDAMSARRAGAIRGETSHDPGDGARRTAGQVRGVTMSSFLDALHSGRVLLMDGAMGTELRARGCRKTAAGKAGILLIQSAFVRCIRRMPTPVQTCC